MKNILECLMIICLIINIPIFIFIYYKFTTAAEINYFNAIKTWGKKPIFDISKIPLHGYEKYYLFNQENIETFCDCTYAPRINKPCSFECKTEQILENCIEYSKNKAYLYESKEIYVKYYDADYHELFSRVHEEHIGKCKTNYVQCGRLDAFNNAFCVSYNEKCPINYFDIDNFITDNKALYLPIINQLYVSENQKAKIFDTNTIMTQIDVFRVNNDTTINDELFYNLSYMGKNTSKINFIKENHLIEKGNYENISEFKNQFFRLYHLVYPGNLIDYSMEKKFFWIKYFRIFELRYIYSLFFLGLNLYYLY